MRLVFVLLIAGLLYVSVTPPSPAHSCIIDSHCGG